MGIFGSYIDKKRSLLGESVNIAVLDTFVAFVSGLIIFPSCSAFGISPDQGPQLIFITLPNIFNNMTGGAEPDFYYHSEYICPDAGRTGVERAVFPVPDIRGIYHHCSRI